MNIDDYRAMVEQQKADATHKEQTTTADDKTKQIETPETKIEKEEIKIPDKIEIEGIGEVPITELKNGYLRTKDYTQKTQEIAKIRKESEEAIKFYDSLKGNPELAKTLSTQTKIPDALDPNIARVLELESTVYDLMLQNEIKELQGKYADFDIVKVLEKAQEKKLTNLEDAYLLTINSTNQEVDIDALKKQIKEEMLKEMEAEKNATRTVITSGGSAVVQEQEVKVSEAEKKVAINMFRNVKDPVAEYVKWRDMKKK